MCSAHAWAWSHTLRQEQTCRFWIQPNTPPYFPRKIFSKKLQAPACWFSSGPWRIVPRKWSMLTFLKHENSLELARALEGEERAAGKRQGWARSAQGPSAGGTWRPLCHVASLGLTALLCRGAGISTQLRFGLGGFLFPSPSEGYFKITNGNWGEEAQFDTFEPCWGRVRGSDLEGLLGGEAQPRESLSAPFREGHRIRVSSNGVFLCQTCQ